MPHLAKDFQTLELTRHAKKRTDNSSSSFLLPLFSLSLSLSLSLDQHWSSAVSKPGGMCSFCCYGVAMTLNIVANPRSRQEPSTASLDRAYIFFYHLLL